MANPNDVDEFMGRPGGASDVDEFMARSEATPAPSTWEKLTGAYNKYIDQPLTKFFSMPKEGVKNVAEGYRNIREAVRTPPGAQPVTTASRETVDPRLYKGLSQTIRGTGQVAAPFALPLGIVTAPIPTIAGLAGGAAAGAGARAVAPYTSMGPEQAELFEDVANIAGGMAAGYGGSRLLKSKTPPGGGGPSGGGPSGGGPPPPSFSSQSSKLLNRALRPPGGDIKFSERLQSSAPEIALTAAETKKPITGLQDLLENVKLSKERLWKQYQDIAGPMAKAEVDMTPLADAIDKSIPRSMRIENPQAVEAMEAMAGQYRGRKMPLAEVEELLHEFNDQLDSYYAKNPTAQRSAAAKNPDTAATHAKAEATRKAIYERLDVNEGKVPREIKRRYGDLLDLESHAVRRYNDAIRSAPAGLLEHLGSPEAGIPLGWGVAKGSIPEAAFGLGTGLVKKWLGDRHAIDAMIQRAFRGYQGRPTPLGKAMRGLPAPPDTSFVRPVPTMEPMPNVQRGLPAPDIVTPYPGPSYVKSVPGRYPPKEPIIPQPNVPPSRWLPPGPKIRITPPPLVEQWDPVTKTFVMKPPPGFTKGGLAFSRPLTRRQVLRSLGA